jgi:WD40 repeat protein
VVVGTKSGELIVYDIAASAILSTYSAHTGAVWGVHVRPDGRGIVSASADKDVKFWDFEMKETDSGERIMNRLGQETVVCPRFQSTGNTDEVDQDKTAYAGSRSNIEVDGSSHGCQIQS